MAEPAWMRDIQTGQEGRPAWREPGETRAGGLMRRLGSVLKRYTIRNERLRLCETLPLGGRRSVALLECDGQRFLAGMSANGVETLVPLHSSGSDGDRR